MSSSVFPNVTDLQINVESIDDLEYIASLSNLRVLEIDFDANSNLSDDSNIGLAQEDSVVKAALLACENLNALKVLSLSNLNSISQQVSFPKMVSLEQLTLSGRSRSILDVAFSSPQPSIQTVGIEYLGDEHLVLDACRLEIFPRLRQSPLFNVDVVSPGRYEVKGNYDDQKSWVYVFPDPSIDKNSDPG